MSNQLRLAVGIPAYGGSISAEHARMWLEFGNVIGAANERFRLTIFGVADTQPVDRARNMLVAQAMLHNSDWLLMVDADTWVLSDGQDDAGFQLARMISEGAHAGAALVSAAVVRRASRVEEGLTLAVYGPPNADGVYDAGLPTKWLSEQRRALVNVHAVGAACFAVNLNKLAEAEISYAFAEGISEDLYVCKKLREKYGENAIKVDPRVITAHLSRPFALKASMG